MYYCLIRRSDVDSITERILKNHMSHNLKFQNIILQVFQKTVNDIVILVTI